MSPFELVTIELEGTLKGIAFKPEGKDQNVVCTVTIKCQPNQSDSGRLSGLAGKDVEVTISSRQLNLPMKDQV